MIWNINGFPVNDLSNGVYLQEPIQGLELTPSRTSSGDYSGRPGGYVGAQFDGMRLVTLNGYIDGGTPSGLMTLRKQFQAAVAGSPLPCTFVDDGGNSYSFKAYRQAFNMPFDGNLLKSTWKLDLLVPDPNLYDNSSGGAVTINIPIKVQGGLTWPIVWPLVWAAGSVPTTVTNTGTVTIYPKFTLTDIMTNPTITNLTSGQSFTLNGLITTAGDVVTIDMRARTVLLNGGSILSYRTGTSSWIGVPPGDSAFEFSTISSGDTVVCNLSWQAAVRGI